MEDVELVNKETTDDSIKEDRRWCVYIHRNKANNKCYIGITSKSPEQRWGHNGCGYKKKNSVFARALEKYPDWENDWEHIIFAAHLAEQEAKHMEVLLIALYKTNCCVYKNPSYGYNMTDGGDGTVGWEAAEETKKKISVKAKNRFSDPQNHPMYGKQGLGGQSNPMFGVSPKDRMDERTYQQWYEKHVEYWENNPRKGVPLWKDKTHPSLGRRMPDYQKEVLSQKALKRYQNKENHPMYGQHHTDESRARMSEKRKNGQMYCCKPIYCPELNQYFYAAPEAEKMLHICASTIRKCCNGKRKSAGKHPITGEELHWMNIEDAVANNYISQHDLDEYLNNLKNKKE